ncbi:MAG: hypothetical protein QM500_17725 [Methylococcales bacterium]
MNKIIIVGVTCVNGEAEGVPECFIISIDDVLIKRIKQLSGVVKENKFTLLKNIIMKVIGVQSY